MNGDLQIRLARPAEALEPFVHCFSSLDNLSDFEEGIIIPNGRVDLVFSRTAGHQFQVALIGLETKPKSMPDRHITGFSSISFNPLAAEYILKQPIADIVDSGRLLAPDFWGFGMHDLDDFEGFCRKASEKISALLPTTIDERKRHLFELIFSARGEISVSEVAARTYWSQRQINRYFHQQFGLSLKSYCQILRFQASLPDIKAGRLFPRLNFADQSHFIKEVKKLSGVSPKELSRNHNGRFLQFLAVDEP